MDRESRDKECQRPQSRFVKSPAGAQREMLIKAALLLRRQVITARMKSKKLGDLSVHQGP